MRLSARFFAAAIFAATFSTSAFAVDWPQWLGPDRDGLTKETGLLKELPEGGPKRAWLFEDCGYGYSGFSIVDGVLYTMGARPTKAKVEADAGAQPEDTAKQPEDSANAERATEAQDEAKAKDDEEAPQCQLIALDASSGKELWHVDLGPMLQNDWGGGPRSTPTVVDGRVYALGGKGTLVCVNAKDGSEIWRTNLLERLSGTVPDWGYCESVLVDGDLVLCTPGGADGAIAALDKATGEVRWRATELDDKAHYSSIVRAEINGQPQYVQLFEKRVVGISPDDGHLLWQSEFPGRVAVIPTPIVRDNKIFVTAGYGAGCSLVEIGPDNVPKELYDEDARKLMKNHHGGVLLVGDCLYGHSDGTGWICMDFATGEQKWREREILGKGAIAYADGMFYCLGEEDGEVVLIDASPAGWQEHGRFTLEPQTKIRSDRGKIWTHPVIANGKLYLRDQDLVYCYDIKAE
jgi:outer membrane protein assembly factor BamB